MSKVFIGVGHGGSDSGAVGYLVEKDVNLNMAIACKNYLEANGVEVMMSRYKDEEDSLNEEARECNAYSPDLAIDVHNNAGGGDGFEVYHTIYGGVGKALAENIENEVIAIGQNSRGIKTRQGNRGDYYGFIRMTKCPAVITEGVFVDNKADASQADELYEQEQFGIAYAKGILKTLGIVANNQTAGSQNSPKQENKIKNEITYDIIKKGSKGNLVKIAQDKLIAKGYSLNKYGADSNFGTETENAVKQLQGDAGITVDGIIGKDTWTVLNSNFVKPNKPTYPNYLIRKGQKGEDVRKIQTRLIELGYSCGKYGADSNFGNDTENAVKAFQRNNGLVVDGIVGPKTWNKLF